MVIDITYTGPVTYSRSGARQMTTLMFSNLSVAFDRAVLAANNAINAMPADLDVYEEHDLIEAASAEALAIATHIVTLPATLASDTRIKDTAQAWLDGERQDNGRNVHNLPTIGAMRHAGARR
jgi:hypothetical protein